MLREQFSLSEKGADDLKKGIIFSTAADLSLMLPVALFIVVIDVLLSPLLGKPAPSLNIWLYTGTGAVILAIIYAVHLLQYQFTYVASYNESANRRIALAEKIRKLPLSFFGKRDLSDLTNTMMGDCTALEHAFSHAFPQGFGAVLSIILASAGLFVIDWRMSIALFAALPVSLALVIGSRRLQDKYSLKKILTRRAASDGVQECLEAVKDIKACGREDEYLAGLDKKFDDVISASMKSEVITGCFISSGTAVLRIGFAAVILAGAVLLGQGEISVIIYLVFLLVAARIYDPLSTVFMQTAEMFDAMVQIDRMKEIENYPVQEGADRCENKGYDIVFENVSFSYNDEKALKNVFFTAEQGKVTALAGPSGSGKSTAAKLAARFWDADSGRILLGGQDVSKVEPETLLKNFSIVFQDVVLFRDTIMENIRIGRKNAPDEEVFAAARAAQCDDFISEMPDGYQTVIGENGATLSGGERQRISIARALLKDAPVILLDEATASLDVENETLIQSALSKLIKDRTVIVIAHRMRTIAGADKIVVLDKGRIAEEGDSKTLLEKNGLYARLYSLQQKVV
ncbi:ATP-binding cassette subfamily B protein [Methanomicrobium sp. W14]|nr:ABC transporter ATP-binding protein [Methanomicrobium sp. W14]MBP2133299.1 ATP-binding cassette subfamily B protein [Methanomicrobium sp. W14]